MKAHCKPNQSAVGVCCIDHDCCDRAKNLLAIDGFSLLEQSALPLASQEIYVRCERSGFALMPQDHSSGAVVTAFAASAHPVRAQRGKQLLIKAVGGGALRPTVVDATAGLGRDAAVLHGFGFPVIMLERNPVLHAMLARDLDAMADAPGLFNDDAADWLRQPPAETTVDVVYLDPMFSDAHGTAAVKKELGYLRRLLQAETESSALFDAAIAAARYRVVVKRALKARPFAERPPSYSLRGKAIRFDVYTRRAYPRAENSRSSTP